MTGFLLLDAPAASSPQPPAEEAPQESFEDRISVSELEMVVRVVDTWGRPILNLKPEDFRVRLGKSEVPIAGLDWISAEDSAILELPAEMASPQGGEGDEVTVALPAPGRLVVLFVQTDLNPTRISGQMRMRSRTRKLLDSLHPQDRAAVVSFDSRLKLWQDFTLDRDAVHAALDRAVLYGKAPVIEPAGEVSLAQRFDFEAARKTATPERALEVTARALDALPGEKMMIFLGYGFGNFSRDGVGMRPSYAPAVRALWDARISVFALDITSADSHSLEAGLKQVAADTGGLYLSTFRLPNLATEVLSKAISGYYILALDMSRMPDATGEIQVELKGRRGTVIARPMDVR
ncbi:MAG TPA: VWA domain-containing protein [Thermoanaerobaculia bacterium]|nr:VWA domain-containing protein [Thermoanaerobaculia bacterium]